jgi:hypothetical protein
MHVRYLTPSGCNCLIPRRQLGFCDTISGGVSGKLRPTWLSAAENVRGNLLRLALTSWPVYQAFSKPLEYNQWIVGDNDCLGNNMH